MFIGGLRRLQTKPYDITEAQGLPREGTNQQASSTDVLTLAVGKRARKEKTNYLDLQKGLNNGPYTDYTLCFGIFGHYFGFFWRSRYNIRYKEHQLTSQCLPVRMMAPPARLISLDAASVASGGSIRPSTSKRLHERDIEDIDIDMRACRLCVCLYLEARWT